MITPNIEELMALADRYATLRIGEGTANARKELHDAMQSQAERIKELEAEIITRASYGDEQTDFAIKLAAERDALRAELAEIENVEPVIWAISYDGVTPYTLWHEGNGPLLDYEVKRQGGTTQKMPLYTRPMPAQDVKDAERYQWLREYMISSATVYDDLIVAANSSVSFDRVIDTALANAKGAK